MRFEHGMLHSIITASVPKEFTQLVHNRKRSVVMSGNNIVFAPAYGPPFIRSLDFERRYATIDDFQNLLKLAYMSDGIHQSGGVVCETVDVRAGHRRLEMNYSHIKFADKAFTGTVTTAERAQDSVDMARILFGREVLDNNTCLTSLINVNSPLALDGTMSGALKIYARARAHVDIAGLWPIGQTVGGAMAGRGGRSHSTSKILDTQCMHEAASFMMATALAGTNFVIHAAGSLEGGLSMSYEKFVTDANHLANIQRLLAGIDLSEPEFGLDAYQEVGPGKHFLGCAHTLARYKGAFFESALNDSNSFEQWAEEGSTDLLLQPFQLK